MREILFRGKRIDNGEWLEGWYQPPIEGRHLDGRVESLGASLAFVGEDGFLEDAYIIAETIGQFTGVTDKNGTKIFEGDIVKIFDAAVILEGCGVVNWSGLFSAWHIGETTLYGSEHCAKYEVIGNIHGNPELLKGE